MPQQVPPPTRLAPVRASSPPDWTQDNLFPLDDQSLRKSALIRVSVVATLDGRSGLQEIGYEITNLNGDHTLALAHNVIPGCDFDRNDLFQELAGQQHLRAQRLLLPF